MSIMLDVAGVAKELDRLAANPHLRKLAIVLERVARPMPWVARS